MAKRRKQTLRDYIEIKHGFAFPSESYSQSGEWVLLTPGNFREEGGFRWLGEKQKYFVGYVPSEYILSAGQMLVAMTEQAPGLLGSTFFVPNNRTYLHNQRLGLITIKDLSLLHPKYLHYFLSSLTVRAQIAKESAGTKVKHTSPDKLLALSIEPPVIEEQIKIATFLETWDQAIEMSTALVRDSIAQHASLVHNLVLGQNRVARSPVRSSRQKHRWFALPSEWSCQRIGSLAQEVSERYQGDETAEILSCSKYDGFVRSLDYFKKQVFSSDLNGYKRIYRGDFGFPSNHVEEGSIGLQDVCDVGLVSPIYIVFRFDSNIVDNEYAHYMLKTSLYRHIFEVSTSASVDRRGSLRWNEFAAIPFPVPPLQEQREIVQILHTSAKRITSLRAQKVLIEEQKRGLMRKLLTGEWRLPC